MEARLSCLTVASQLEFRLLVENGLYLLSCFLSYFQANCRISLPTAVAGL